jgi:hypothetical protein
VLVAPRDVPAAARAILAITGDADAWSHRSAAALAHARAAFGEAHFEEQICDLLRG